MSLRIDHQELNKSLREALIKDAHSFSNSVIDGSVRVEEFDLNEMQVDVEIRSIDKPPLDAYELVPPPNSLEATDVNICIQIMIKISVPDSGNRVELDVKGNIHKPIYNFATVHGQVSIRALKFECLLNVALVNGYLLVWGGDFVLEPSFSISETDAFLSAYLTESTRKFLTAYFSQMQHILSI